MRGRPPRSLAPLSEVTTVERARHLGRLIDSSVQTRNGATAPAVRLVRCHHRPPPRPASSPRDGSAAPRARGRPPHCFAKSIILASTRRFQVLCVHDPVYTAQRGPSCPPHACCAPVSDSPPLVAALARCVGLFLLSEHSSSASPTLSCLVCIQRRLCALPPQPSLRKLNSAFKHFPTRMNISFEYRDSAQTPLLGSSTLYENFQAPNSSRDLRPKTAQQCVHLHWCACWRQQSLNVLYAVGSCIQLIEPVVFHRILTSVAADPTL